MKLKYIAWTTREDNTLKELFHIEKENYKGRWGSSLNNIKIALEKRGINRSEHGIQRRLNRLGLQFFRLTKGDIILNCIDCNKTFFGWERFINRNKGKQTRCSRCEKIQRRKWDKDNAEKMKEYYRIWKQEHKRVKHA